MLVHIPVWPLTLLRGATELNTSSHLNLSSFKPLKWKTWKLKNKNANWVVMSSMSRRVLAVPPPSQTRTAVIGWKVEEEDEAKRCWVCWNWKWLPCFWACVCVCVCVCVCLHPHVCLIVPAVRVETEVWQRARWVIRLSPCALKVTVAVYLHPAAAAAAAASDRRVAFSKHLQSCMKLTHWQTCWNLKTIKLAAETKMERIK